MYKLSFIIVALIMLASCGPKKQAEGDVSAPAATVSEESGTNSPDSYDPKRGQGKFTNMVMPPKLDQAMATKGENIASVKCTSCHKTTDEKLVGPGWKGVTQRHAPEWIMNFITNPDPMIDKDPKAQAMLEICLVRMPNQSLADEDARSLLEYMRKNDGVK